MLKHKRSDFYWLEWSKVSECIKAMEKEMDQWRQEQRFSGRPGIPGFRRVWLDSIEDIERHCKRQGQKARGKFYRLSCYIYATVNRFMELSALSNYFLPGTLLHIRSLSEKTVNRTDGTQMKMDWDDLRGPGLGKRFYSLPFSFILCHTWQCSGIFSGNAWGAYVAQRLKPINM